MIRGRARVLAKYGRDAYLTCLTYRSTTSSAVLHMRHERRHRGGRLRWFFSFGERLEFGPHKSKLDAIIEAAHKLGMSGKQADFDPML